MRALDVLPLPVGEMADVGDAERGSGDGGRRAGDAIGGLEVVGRGRAEEPVVHLGAHKLAQLAPLHGLAAESEGRVFVPGPKVHELERELVVVLERMNEARRIDLVSLLEPEHEAQELGIAGDEGVVIRRARHEIVGKIGASLGHGLDVLEGEVELLEGKAPELAHQAGDELVGSDREGMALGPRAAIAGPDFDTEESVGIEPQHSLAQRSQGVQRVSRDQPLRGKGGIEPVEGWLSFLEVVQVDPPAHHAVGPGDGLGG
jgi:hypothetical protein